MFKQCRTCTSILNEQNSNKLDDTIIIHNTKMKLSEILLECASVQISDYDMLPKYICHVCTDKAYSAYQFKHLCEESQLVLIQNMLRVPDINDISQTTSCKDGNDYDVLAFVSIKEDNKFSSQLLNITETRYEDHSDKEDTEDNNTEPSTEACASIISDSKQDILINKVDGSCSISASKGTTLKKKTNKKLKKYQCPHCPNIYKNMRHFNSHKIMVHRRHYEAELNTTAEKYQCSECPNFYYNKTSLQNHQEMKHKSSINTELSKEEGKYQCTKCPNFYDNEQSYNAHMVAKHSSQDEPSLISDIHKNIDEIIELPLSVTIDSNGERYQCPLCPSFYDLKKSYKMHLRRKHTVYYEAELKKKGVEYQCPHCPDIFYNLSKFNIHKNTQHTSQLENEVEPNEAETYQCPLCPSYYDQKKSYQMHLRRKHTAYYDTELKKKGLEYQCPYCADIFYNLSKYNVHKNSQHASQLEDEGESSGTKKYQCPRCPSFYYIKKSYKIHQKRNHRADYDAELNQDKNAHQCPDCPNIYSNKHSYSVHLRKEHGKRLSDELSVQTTKHQCVHCDQSFSSRSSFYKHCAMHTWGKNHANIIPEDEEDEDSNCNDNFNDTVWYKYKDSCTECCENFTTDELLKEHQQIHDTFICRICRREFKTCMDLKEHFICHQDFEYVSYFGIATNEESAEEVTSAKASYECDKCDVTFPTLGQINVHKACHPPYICQHCGVIFNLMSTLDNHVRKLHSKNDVICKPCVECNEIFYSHNMLEAHYSSHKQFTCKTCSLQFEKHSLLRNHILYECNSFTDDLCVVYRCNCCNKQFTSRELFAQHSKERTDQCCTYCGLKISLNSISKHLTYHSTEVGFACFVSLCNTTFASSVELEQHLTSHEVLTCGDCNDAFNNLEDLRSHYFGQLCSMAKECKECGLTFENHNKLMKHYNMHNNLESNVEEKSLEFNYISSSVDDTKETSLNLEHKCIICEKVFISFNNLKLHKKKVHFFRDNVNSCPYCEFVGDNKAILTQHMHGEHANYKTWFCTECDKGFFTKASLHAHTKSSHNFSKHICDICGNSYNNTRNLAIHMRNHTGEKPYKCKICGKSFAHHTSLKYHLAYHKDVRNFQCDICGMSFHLRGALLVHKRRHAGIKGNYPCKVCGKYYESNYKLNVHLTVHTGEKNFHCDVCKKSFSRKCSLTLHMRTHTGEKPYACTICDKRFTQKHVLRSHMNTHGEITKSN